MLIYIFYKIGEVIDVQLKEISFEIIQRCPNNCIYCSSNSSCQSKHIINYDVFKRTVDDAINLGLERICISGGEPFLHPDIVDIVQYCKKNGLEVFIYTSGIIFNCRGSYDNISMTILEELGNIGLDRIIFNVQSSDEKIYNSIMRTENCFNLMKSSIRNSVKANLFCEIHFVPMRLNYKMIYSMLDMAKELGVHKVSFLRLVIQGRALKNKMMVELPKDINYNIKIILSSIEKGYNDIDVRIGIPLSTNSNYSCNASSSKLIIRYDGAVFPCEAFKYISAIDGERVVKPDNIYTSSLRTIYHDSEFLNIIRTEIKEFRNQKVICESCPAQWRLTKILNQ